jgi:hypothetical protein
MPHGTRQHGMVRTWLLLGSAACTLTEHSVTGTLFLLLSFSSNSCWAVSSSQVVIMTSTRLARPSCHGVDDSCPYPASAATQPRQPSVPLADVLQQGVAPMLLMHMCTHGHAPASCNCSKRLASLCTEFAQTTCCTVHTINDVKSCKAIQNCRNQ